MTDFPTKRFLSAATAVGVWSPGLLQVQKLSSQQDSCLRTSGTQHSPRRVFSVPEDVVDTLESDLVVEDLDGPVEVFAMTDAVPEEFEGRPAMGRRVVLVP